MRRHFDRKPSITHHHLSAFPLFGIALSKRAFFMLETYRQQAAERAAMGIPALPLTRNKPLIWSNC
jgi:hypothetical protein